jgi:hypothetical protein
MHWLLDCGYANESDLYRLESDLGLGDLDMQLS